MKMHEVSDLKRYLQGVKYGGICHDSKTGKLISMDNHHHKRDHIHIVEKEILYEFTTIEKMISDFKKLVLKHL